MGKKAENKRRRLGPTWHIKGKYVSTIKDWASLRDEDGSSIILHPNTVFQIYKFQEDGYYGITDAGEIMETPARNVLKHSSRRLMEEIILDLELGDVMEGSGDPHPSDHSGKWIPRFELPPFIEDVGERVVVDLETGKSTRELHFEGTTTHQNLHVRTTKGNKEFDEYYRKAMAGPPWVDRRFRLSKYILLCTQIDRFDPVERNSKSSDAALIKTILARSEVLLSNPAFMGWNEMLQRHISLMPLEKFLGQNGIDLPTAEMLEDESCFLDVEHHPPIAQAGLEETRSVEWATKFIKGKMDRSPILIAEWYSKFPDPPKSSVRSRYLPYTDYTENKSPWSIWYQRLRGEMSEVFSPHMFRDEERADFDKKTTRALNLFESTKALDFDKLANFISKKVETFSDEEYLVFYAMRYFLGGESILLPLLLLSGECNARHYAKAVLAGFGIVAASDGPWLDEKGSGMTGSPSLKLPRQMKSNTYESAVKGPSGSMNVRSFKGKKWVDTRNYDDFVDGIAEEAKVMMDYISLAIPDIQVTIDQGEGYHLEFKASLRKNLRTNERDRNLQYAALKEIVGFTNADGGTLLLGVEDSGRICGIEVDGFDNEDQYKLHLSNLIGDHIRSDLVNKLSITFHKVNDRTVLQIDCPKLSEPHYLDKEFFIRRLSQTIKLEGQDLANHIRQIDV